MKASTSVFIRVEQAAEGLRDCCTSAIVQVAYGGPKTGPLAGTIIAL